ncbi:MAG TPA: right-handed parallel beta-helix repeat-containing protein [Gemmata sp.]|nr:right-handed parallel beta-helix repeat-containing protein [Gemmata sp.]
MRSLVSKLVRRAIRSRARGYPAVRPRLEMLEDRLAPATFTVTNTNNSGAGSLRQAILNANANAGSDTISFNIPNVGGPSIHVISPTSALPTVTGTVFIRGATEPGFSGAPLIELDGNLAGSSSQGLLLSASDCVVDSLSIVGFGQFGIDIKSGTGNVVSRCDIGIEPTNSALGNGAGGVLLSQLAQSNLIETSTISGNSGYGVELSGTGTSGNVIKQNRIGTGTDGTGGADVTAVGVAVLAGASVNRIIGNVIAANHTYGVMLLNAGTTGNNIVSNIIGLDSQGNLDNNGVAGVYIGLAATGNAIGGPTITSENVISGNGLDGVLIDGVATIGNMVENNLIGVGSNGAAREANGANGIAVQDGASSDSIVGNVIGFQSVAGVLLDGASHTLVSSNLVGISRAGGNIGNPGQGIMVADGATKNVISGNDIGNNGEGVTLGNGVQVIGTGTTGNIILKNTIGLTASGVLASNGFGIAIEGGASGNRIGGPSAAQRNVVSANFVANVEIDDASGNVVQSNFLGTNAAGTTAGPMNTLSGLEIIDSAGNLIGGVGAGNVISGNDSPFESGIDIAGSGSTGNVVQGNKIGTNLAGTATIANSIGITIEGGANHNQIGGTAPGTGNIVSGNSSLGVFITNANTANNVVQGNRIGVGIAGQALANGVGIEIDLTASNNLIGGTAAHAGNIIAGNTNQGVIIGSSTSDLAIGNAVLGNSIFGNGGLGIDLADNGVTANHPGEGVSGPNDFQNYPVLGAATLAGGDVVVSGTLNGVANTTYRVEFFASVTADPSGHGPGQVYLGYTTVTTDASGNASFAAALRLAGFSGRVISATAIVVESGNTAATLTFGDTSEFSASITA